MYVTTVTMPCTESTAYQEACRQIVGTFNRLDQAGVHCHSGLCVCCCNSEVHHNSRGAAAVVDATCKSRTQHQLNAALHGTQTAKQQVDMLPKRQYLIHAFAACQSKYVLCMTGCREAQPCLCPNKVTHTLHALGMIHDMQYKACIDFTINPADCVCHGLHCKTQQLLPHSASCCM